jgi:hypothetical protein
MASAEGTSSSGGEGPYARVRGRQLLRTQCGDRRINTRSLKNVTWLIRWARTPGLQVVKDGFHHPIALREGGLPDEGLDAFDDHGFEAHGESTPIRSKDKLSFSRLDPVQSAIRAPGRPGGGRNTVSPGPIFRSQVEFGRRSWPAKPDYFQLGRPDSITTRAFGCRCRDWFPRDHSGTLTAQPSPDRRDIRARRRIDRATQRGRRGARGDRVVCASGRPE